MVLLIQHRGLHQISDTEDDEIEVYIIHGGSSQHCAHQMR